MFKILRAKIPPQTSSPPPVSLLTTKENPWKDICTPFKHAKFDGNLHLSIALLVVEPQGKMFPIFRFSKFRDHHLHHTLTGHYYSQKLCGGIFLDLINALNPEMVSV